MTLTGAIVSARRWLRIRRAQMSLPAILANHTESTALSWISGINGGLAMVTICLLAWITELPLMFPALGPTAFVLMNSPFALSAAPRTVVVGHFAAITIGALVWQFAELIGLGSSPPHVRFLDLSAVWVAFAALSITAFTLIRLNTPHAPACASALIVAMGGVSEILQLLLMAGSVVVVTLQAVTINHLANVHTPIWSANPSSHAVTESGLP